MFEFFQSIFQKLGDAFASAFSWLGNLLASIFNAIKSFFATLFAPIILFFKGLFYVLERCFDIVVLVVQCIFGLFKVIGSVIVGIFHTFSQLMGFSGSTGYYHVPTAYDNGFDAVGNFMAQTGLNSIALIMAAFVWMLAAYAVIRIAGGGR